MRHLGPTWWESEDACFHSQISLWPEEYDERQNNYIRAVWTPAGEVWGWQTTRDEAVEKGGAKLQNSSTMEERCELIEKLGGGFYGDPNACPYLDLP